MGFFDEHKYDNTLEIKSDGSEKVEYRFESVGYLHGEEVNPHDEIGNKYIEGHVLGGKDTVSFNGAPKGFKFISGSASSITFVLNGDEVDPFHLKMRTIRIETPENKAPYRFTVDPDGRIIGSGSTNPTEVIGPSGSSARGRVRNGHDEWYFSGNLTGWPDSNQKLKVTVDNKVYEYSGNPPLGAI